MPTFVLASFLAIFPLLSMSAQNWTRHANGVKLRPSPQTGRHRTSASSHAKSRSRAHLIRTSSPPFPSRQNPLRGDRRVGS
jgi:hypothetical protein